MDFSPETLRKRWDELQPLNDAIEAKLEPLRAELNAIVAGDVDMSVKDARTREAEIRPQIKALQAELAPIEMERAAVARALGRRGLVEKLATDEAPILTADTLGG